MKPSQDSSHDIFEVKKHSRDYGDNHGCQDGPDQLEERPCAARVAEHALGGDKSSKGKCEHPQQIVMV